MSKIEVDHTKHISPGELQGLIDRLEESLAPSQYDTNLAIECIISFREILLEAYTTSLNAEDPEFWGGKPKRNLPLFQRGPFIRSSDQ